VIFNFQELVRGEQTDSRKLNGFFRAIGDDVSELYTGLSQLDTNLEAQVDAAGASNDALIAQMNIIQNSLSGVTDSQTYLSFFDPDNVLYPTITETSDTQKAELDTTYGATTLAITVQHREFLHLDPNTGTYILPQNIEDYLEYYITSNRFLPKVDRIIENDVSRILDDNAASAFITKVFTSNPAISDIEQIFTVRMEAEKEINMIKIIPVPEMGIDLTSLEIDSPGGGYGTLRKIDGTEYSVPITNAQRQILPIYPTNCKAIRFGVKQRTRSATIPYQFLLGVRHLSIEANTYSNLSYICLKFPVPAGKTGFSELVPNWIADSNTVLSVYTDKERMLALDPNPLYRSDTMPLLPPNPIIFSDSPSNIYLLFKMQTPTAIASTPIVYGAKVRWV